MRRASACLLGVQNGHKLPEELASGRTVFCQRSLFQLLFQLLLLLLLLLLLSRAHQTQARRRESRAAGCELALCSCAARRGTAGGCEACRAEATGRPAVSASCRPAGRRRQRRREGRGRAEWQEAGGSSLCRFLGLACGPRPKGR